ncbi:9313_t:CDS:2 [Ambispora leptoticha]|uniref:9313_t:CDS:1 n=1 Tax=Ambispora leptoticha TaxID=144679 RepID=A0A9N9BFY8_9GLOM|nr:9313_t:CDS:2 [Ambispora leptoticha]
MDLKLHHHTRRQLKITLRLYLKLLLEKEQNFIQESFVNDEIFDDLKANNIYLEILNEQISITFDIQNLKPTEDLCLEIQNALKSNIPIQNLKLVFQKFGHYIHKKLILGNKLQRIVLKENTEHVYYLEEFNDFSKIEEWKQLVQPFDSSYMITMNGHPIELSSGYQRIEYESQLKSDNYQLFGNVLTCEGKRITDVYVKFSMKTKFGFSVNWHDRRQGYIQANDDRRPYMLQWILIGCPCEIGYFDSNTRDIPVNVGVKEIKLTHYTETHYTETVKIDVGNPLLQKNIVAFDFEYALLSSFLFFETNILKWDISGSIEVQIELIKEEYDKIIDERDDFTVVIRWCVLE